MADSPTPDTAEPGVFVSYASTDVDRVGEIVAVFKGAGVRAWMDRSGIPGGANYGPEIVAAIRGSGALVLCCSAAAFASRNVRQEVALAWKHERPILPLLLEPAAIPDDLAYWLEAAQWVEVLDRPEDEWLTEVLRALRRLGVVLDLPPAPARDPVVSSAGWLPTPLTALLGRDAEVREVGALLASHRLVTLTGPGGVGKTRLAIEAARAATPSFPDGVSFADLTPVREPALVLPAVARVLGVREAPDRSLVEAIATVLGGRGRLLVLDNLEQVVAAAPDVATLLAACPGLAVLATSRTPLAVRGERVFPVEPLSLPRASTAADLDNFAAIPAIALFAERAADARSGFAVTADNAEVVAAICDRLDGLPLAIELAAAWTRHLPPAALLSRLETRLPVLTGGARDLPARQRTLRDTVAWSHDLLSPEEQTLFRRLGVFVDGFPLSGAEATAELGQEGAVFAVLSALVDQSLVRREDGPDGEPRFRMLETVREFAVEWLAASGEEASLRDRHAAWALALTAPFGGRMWQGAETRLLNGLAAEHANLRAALIRLEGAGRGEDLLRLVGGLFGLWYFFGFEREGRDWCARALALAPGAPPALRAAVLLAQGNYAADLGEYDTAERSLIEGAALAAQLGNAGLAADGRYLLATIAEDRGDYRVAEDHLRAALAGYEATGEHLGHAATVYHLGIQAFGRGDVAAATALWEATAAAGRAKGFDLLVVWCLTYLGLAAADQGDLPAAASALGASLAFEVGEVFRHNFAKLLGSMAVLAANGGMPEEAARLLGAAQAEQAATGLRVAFPERLVVERAEGRLRAALGEDAFARAFAEGGALGREAVLAEVEAVLAKARGPEMPASDRG